MTESPHSRSKASNLSRLIVVAVIILATSYLIAGLIPGVYARARMSARVTASAGHLRQIGNALRIYAENPENKSSLPLSLAALYPTYISDPAMFVSPCQEHGDELTAIRTNPPAALTIIDYAYEAGLEIDDASAIVSYEKVPVANGRNVLLVGGSVEFVEESAFRARITEQHARIKAKSASPPNSPSH